MLSSIIFAILLLVLPILCLIRKRYQFWEKKKVKCPKPLPLLGNFGPFIFQQMNIGEMVQHICKQFPEESLVGAYYGTLPVLIVQDPEYIKLVASKHFYYFNGREISDYVHNEKFTGNIFFVGGDRWKVTRQNLSPFFTTSKMKNMFYIIEGCARRFESMLEQSIANNDVQDIRLTTARFTMDCICSAGFGVDPKGMTEDMKKNPFNEIAELIFDKSLVGGIKTVARSTMPAVFYKLRQKLFSEEIYNFFSSIISDVFKSRKFKPSERNDFVDLILTFKEKGYIEGDRLDNLKRDVKETMILDVDEKFLISQCIAFYAAGFQTSSMTTSLTLFELAKNPVIQDKVLKEIDTYLAKNNNLNYDCTTELKYLRQCIDECLRMYPLNTMITREVYEDYTFPNGVSVPRGTAIHLPVLYLHRNEKYFPEPDVFRPERFSPEEKTNIKPNTYFPFGAGQRLCIGYRFAIMQMMAGIITILKKYRLELAEYTPTKLKFEPTSRTTQCVESINLKMIPREGWERRVYRPERRNDRTSA